MTSQNHTARSSKNLENFVTSIDSLIQICGHLRQENADLRQQCQQLNADRTRYMQANERSREKLDTTINRLKTLELEL